MANDLDPDDLSRLPADPLPDELWDAYQLGRAMLVKANRSRSALKGHDNRRYKVIADLQAQLQELEHGLREEAETRLRLHALNVRVAEIVKDLETGLDQTAAIVEEPSRSGLSAWVVKLARLLPIALQLRQAKKRALQLLVRDRDGLEALSPADLDSAPLPVLTDAPESEEQAQDIAAPSPQPEPTPPAAISERVVAEPQAGSGPVPTGPLLLKDLDYAFGLLLLHSPGQPIPEGFRLDFASPWLPGQALVVPTEPEDEIYAPIEAGLLALSDPVIAGGGLQQWLERGLLPFAQDPSLRLLRLLNLDQLNSATHVLVQQGAGGLLQEAGASALPLDLDDDLWQGFALHGDEEHQALRQLLRQGETTATASQAPGPRISCRGGVRLVEGQGYLASGLGLPLLAVPAGISLQSVQIRLPDGRAWPYERSGAQDEGDRQLWQPTAELRRLPELPCGRAVLEAQLSDGHCQERSVSLSALEVALPFRRARSLIYREDWGQVLGPLELPSSPPAGQQPIEADWRWAWQRLHQSDYSVNHLFEQQMLESLSALFQRRSSLARREFYALYSQLRNKPDEWPGFAEAVLRGWCEGGWLEEGLERGHGRWRIQAVDPRLVRLEAGGAQLVGLLSARRLMMALATAHQLQLTVRAVLPTCPDMPRGWRFHGDVEALAEACGLPLVEQSAWVPRPHAISWTLERPLACDGGASWPTGLRGQRLNDRLCGRRGLDHHWKPAQPLPERYRAPMSLKIEAETTATGKRRWHSIDPVGGAVFSSCHRNRVALHALIVATDGLWPFGVTDEDTGQLDRLYDAEAYLPLPLARYLALTGSRMPGPTRHQPSDHTYRYHMHRELLREQGRTRLLPLTTCPA